MDSPSSAGVINDFLWLLSKRPSIVDPPRYLCPSFWERRLDGLIIRGTGSAGRQEVEGGFHDIMGFNIVQELCTQDMLLSYVRQPRVKFPVDG